jgi:hypothetical protein
LIEVSEGGARIASVSDLNLHDTCALHIEGLDIEGLDIEGLDIEGLAASIPLIVRDKA